jgi:hypothetical protein
MAKIYKSPLQQSIALKGQRDGVPEFNKEVLIDYLTQYGDFVTDDAYEEWALKKGKQLGPKKHDALGETRYGDYINDEDWLKETWNELYPEAIEYSDHLNQNPKEAASIRSWRGYNKGAK